MFMLEIFYDSGNAPLRELLISKLYKMNGCQRVTGKSENIHNIVRAEFKTEKEAQLAAEDIETTSVRLFPKFKMIIEDTGNNFL